MYWKDENSWKGNKVSANTLHTSVFPSGKESKTHVPNDCRFIPSRKGTNNSYTQYLLKENINTSNIASSNANQIHSSNEAFGQSSFMMDGYNNSSMINHSNIAFNNNNNNNNNTNGGGVNTSYSTAIISGNQSFSGALNGNLSMTANGVLSNQQQSQNGEYHKLMEEYLFNQDNKGGESKNRLLKFKREVESTITLDKCLSNTFESAGMPIAAEQSRMQRYISAIPERILDAPALNDDYYLNLMDWGECGSTGKGTLAISLGSEVYLWNENEIVNLLKLENEADYVSSVSWMGLKKKNCLAVGLSDHTIQLWDTEKCIPYRVLKGHTGRVSSLSWNNYILSSGSRDSMIINHDIRQKQNIVAKFEGHEQEVCGLKWSPDGTQLASGSNDNTLRIWNINSANAPNHFNTNSYQRACFTQHRAAVKALAWCPWSKNLLASGGGTQDKTIKFWNTDKLEMVNSVNCGSQVCSLVWNPNDKELVSSHGFQDNQLIVWNYPTMQKITELHGHSNRVLHMALSPDATTICSASSDETLRFWKVFQGSPYDRSDFDDDTNPYHNNKYKSRDGPFSQNLFIR